MNRKAFQRKNKEHSRSKYAMSKIYCSPDPKTIPHPNFDDDDDEEISTAKIESNKKINMSLYDFIDLFFSGNLDNDKLSNDAKRLIGTATTLSLKTNAKFVFCLFIKSTKLKIQFTKFSASNLVSIKINDSFLCENTNILSAKLKLNLKIGKSKFLQTEEIVFFMCKLLSELCILTF